MNNFLLFIAALLVLALSALFAAPYFIDWNDHRDVFERQASRLIGRTVSVGGDVSLTFLPAPSLSFENVNIADAEGRFDTPFVSAKTFTVWLSVPPLLRGVIEAREVQIDEPVLNLQIGADGSGNWRDVGRADVALPFMPREVALESVKIVDATVTLAQGEEAPHLELDHLDGELSARSLRGPYKFAGTVQLAGETHEVRFSTGRREADAPVRLKATFRDGAGRESYQLDGELAGFDAEPRFEGSLEARFRQGAAAEQTPQEAKGADGQAVAPAPPVEVEAQIEAGPERARFTNVKMTLRHGNRPQTITGELDTAYVDGLAVEGELASRWVDLDVLAGAASEDAEQPPEPSRVVADAARRILDAAGRVKKARVKFALKQAVLGGDVLHGVEAELASAGEGVAVERLSARLPGDNPVSLSGTVAATEDDAPSFEGRIETSGENLNRLLDWAGLQEQPLVASQEGAFSLKGAVEAAPGKLALEQASGHLFGNRFSGSLRRDTAGERVLSLKLQSERLDLSRIAGLEAESLSLPALLGGGAREEGTENPGRPFAWLGEGKARIDLDIGAITLPGLGESAVEAGLDIVAGDIDVRKLHLRSDRGLELEARGSLTGLEKKPHGRITLDARAETTGGVEAFAALLDLEETLAAEAARLRVMVPAQFTATLRSTGEARPGLAFHLEGGLGESQVALDGSIAGALAEWRQARVKADLAINNDSSRQLLRQFFSRLGESDLKRFREQAGVLSFRVSGVPADGLESEAIMQTGGVNWATSGQLTLTDSGYDFSGRTDLGADDASALLALAGIGLAPARVGARLELSGEVEASDGVYEIDQLSGTTPQAAFEGSGRLDLSSDKPRIEAEIEADSASLPLLFEPLIAWDGQEREAAGTVRGVSRTEAFWPDHAVDLALLERADGVLRLKADKLRLAGPLALSEGRLVARLEGGVLDIDAIRGGLYGGSLDAEARLSARGNKLVLDAGAKARGMRLEQLIRGSGGESLVSGPVGLDLSVQGSGLSPRGVAAGLSGEGALEFGAGEIRHLAPQAPKKAVDAFGETGEGGDVDQEALTSAVKRLLDSDGFAYDAFEAPLAVGNGVARAEKVSLESAVGRATVTTFLEVTSLTFDSEWVLASTARNAEEAPHVTLAFAGDLSELGEMRPVIDTQALQRYVTIRRMEQDVERLENLEVPGAGKAENTPQDAAPAETAGEQEEIPSASDDTDENTGTASAPPPSAATTEREAPSPSPPRSAPSSPPERRSRAAPDEDSVISEPLPPAAPADPPTAGATPSQEPLPWLAPEPQMPASSTNGPVPSASVPQPPSGEAPQAISEPPAPSAAAATRSPEAGEPPPRREWNPFQDNGG